jgi:Uma2 family endonuclease
MSSLTYKNWTPDEYLAAERQAEIRHEYVDGYLIAMAGGSGNHGLIISNVNAILKNALASRGCRIYATDVKVGLQNKRGDYFYPDVSVVCERPEWEDKHNDILLNPLLLVEVLSPSTEAYDRGAKLAKYRTIPSLKVFVVISQETPFVEVHERQSFNAWRTTYAESIDSTIDLPVVGVPMQLKDVYDLVEFPSDPPPPRHNIRTTDFEPGAN